MLQLQERLTGLLEEDLKVVKGAFSYPLNTDFAIREIFLQGVKRDAVLLYLTPVVDVNKLEDHIINPLIKWKDETSQVHQMDKIMKNILTVEAITKVYSPHEAIKDIIEGDTLLLIDGFIGGISISTSSYAHRGIEKPEIESVLKGPKEGFVESCKVNRSLIRRSLKNNQLITEAINVGENSQSKVSIMYLKDIANPELIKSVKNRIDSIDSENVLNLSQLEQYIEERPYSLLPSILYSERPDRAAAFLQEGHIILLMDNSPSCLILPITFWSIFHTSEDQYDRVLNGTFLRLIRYISILIALFTPSIYVAATNYHVEMIPPGLFLAIANTREAVPFPSIFELILLEMAFEVLREAGLRVPSPLGPTIGIVGALILGQAAVEAGIISPILVIIVAITGLASFAVSDINFSFSIRIGRFIYLFSAILMGFYGLALAFTASIAYLVTLESFGVPFMAPVAPNYPSSKDTFIRSTIKDQWLRPTFNQPLKKSRKKPPEGS